MEEIRRQRIFLFLKFAVTVLILYFITRRIDFNQLIHDFGNLSVQAITILAITTLIKLFIQYRNWYRYLSVNPRYGAETGEVRRSYFIGLALRFLLPGGIGPFGKMYFVNNKKSATAVSVGIEKIFLTWKNLFFAALVAIFYFQEINIYLKIAIFLIITFFPFILYGIVSHTKRENLQIYCKNYLRIVPSVMLMQIIFVCLTFVQYFVILRNFVSIPFLFVVIAVPLIHVSHIIPITFSGFGLREIFAMEVFSRFGVHPEAAVAATLTIFIFNSVLPALVGIYFMLKAKPVYSKFGIAALQKKSSFNLGPDTPEQK